MEFTKPKLKRRYVGKQHGCQIDIIGYPDIVKDKDRNITHCYLTMEYTWAFFIKEIIDFLKENKIEYLIDKRIYQNISSECTLKIPVIFSSLKPEEMELSCHTEDYLINVLLGKIK